MRVLVVFVLAPLAEQVGPLSPDFPLAAFRHVVAPSVDGLTVDAEIGGELGVSGDAKGSLEFGLGHSGYEYTTVYLWLSSAVYP